MDQKLSNIVVIRCYAILSLVAWHCLCVYVGWNKYLPEIAIATSDNTITAFYSKLATIFMPDANMPLFTIISGYVYASLRKEGRYLDTLQFVKKKARRLLVPYFVIGTIVVLTIYDWSPSTILQGQAHHLWYCAMLFWCFVYIIMYSKYNAILKISFILICLILHIFHVNSDILGIVRGMRYFPYFLFGCYLALYLQRLQSVKRAKLYSFLSWFIALIIFLIFKKSSLLLPVCYFFSLMIFVFIPINVRPRKFVVLISEYSFGIYVFHEWFLWNFSHLNFCRSFIIEHQLMYPIIAYIIVLIISLGLTIFSLKTRLGKFLLT